MSSGISLIFAAFLLVEQTADCSTLDDVNQLYLDQLTNYTKLAFPLKNQSDTVQVNISIKLIALQDFNAVTSVLEVVGYFDIQWKDERFGWEPENYGGKESLLIPQNDVWRPSLVLVQPVDAIREIGDKFYKVRVFKDGTVVWTPASFLRTSCSVDITFYPNDVQECDIMVTSGLRTDELAFRSTRDSVDMTKFQENGEWIVLDSIVSVIEHDESSVVIFRVKFERRPLYVVMNLMVPIVLLGIVNGFVFVMPADCGERVSYSVTAFLSFAVFLTMVDGNMPKNSMRMSMLSYYITILLVSSSLIIGAVILNHVLYYKEDAEIVPKRIVLFIKFIRRCCRYPLKRVANGSEPTHGHEDYIEPDGCDNNAGTISAKEQRITKKSSEEEQRVTWRDVAHVIDKTLFVFFASFHVIMTLAFYITTESRTDPGIQPAG